MKTISLRVLSVVILLAMTLSVITSCDLPIGGGAIESDTDNEQTTELMAPSESEGSAEISSQPEIEGTEPLEWCIVSFNSNGGTNMESIMTVFGETIKEPSEPERDGYKFKGWYLNGTPWDFTKDKVVTDMILDARWEAEASSSETETTLAEETTSAEEPRPEQTEPEDPKPEQTKPEQTEPEDPKPEDPKPEQTEPEQTEPEQTEPEQTKPGHYTYNMHSTYLPSNWNPLSYVNSIENQIIDYINSQLFSYDFKYDETGKIIPCEYVVKYNAAAKLEDVSGCYVGSKWGIADGDTARAWKITLRDDLKWQNGDPIKAEDFVYTMREMLNPLFQNYRASQFYTGAIMIANAEEYLKQGISGWYPATDIYSTYSADLDGVLVFSLAPAGDEIKAEAFFRDYMGFPESYDAAMVAKYLVTNYIGDDTAFTEEAAAAMEGKTLAEIKADATLKAAWDALIGWWQTEPNEELHFFVTNHTYPEVKWEDVGMFVGENEYEIVIILDKSLPLLKEDGSLSYQAAYNMSSLPLVHKATYEACKLAPSEGFELWTSYYNSCVSTTMSWGPYKLEYYKADSQYVIVRNENWYGYGMEENAGLYQTDRIVCDCISWDEAWERFQRGEIESINADPNFMGEYGDSERLYNIPDDLVSSLHFQSDINGLRSRETYGVNKTILTDVNFRRALSLSIDRADLMEQTRSFGVAGYGIFGPMHYYDVENGGVYRNTDEAKKVICEIYNVDYTKYDSIDEAVNSVTGYDIDTAKILVETAYQDALAAGTITEIDKVVLTVGVSSISAVAQARFNYIKNAWTALVEGTSLEGRLELELRNYSTGWADAFSQCEYDVCLGGGWSGSAWDPGYMLLVYLHPDYMFSTYWNTYDTMMTFTMKGVGENGEDITETMGLLDWYECLNGIAGAKYDWSSAALREEQRVQLIAALEKEILKASYTVPLYYNASPSFISYKVEYITYEYNTFMGFGGVKYMTYNYDDAEWSAYVEENGGRLDYTK